MKLDEVIAKAIDTNDAKLAGRVADYCRRHGESYHAILQRVQAVRPDVTEADWESLMYEADELDE